MPYKVMITAYANKSAKKLNPEVKKAAKAVLKELAQNPFQGKELQSELKGFWAYKFLRYRIIFKADIKKKNIVVWAIGHRRDIYEAFGEHLLGLTAEED